MELKARRHDAKDIGDAIDMCYANGWTDGLPVVPPTADRVEKMLAAAKLDPTHQLAFIENRQVKVTAEKVAINAVMAGCLPEYMPVVATAVEALADPKYGYHGPATSTGGSAVFMLVNGPIAKKLNMNSGDNLFGPGWRANATIGRAIRLVMRNVIGTLPGELDRSSMGHGGKYSFCIAENETDSSPWPPFHTTRGLSRDQNAVTVFAALAPHQISNQLSAHPEGILETMCANMRISAGTNRKPQYALIFPGEHQLTIKKAGWTREQVQNYCYEHSKGSLAEYKHIHIAAGDITPDDEKTLVTLVETPQDFLVIAAGGIVGVQSSFIPGWGGKNGSQSVTREIKTA
ncbi:MAG: hypothetical protein FJY56_13380 [Betaproteobacteria bacterium]|nr:hypothetical protein [Betaproteobacteria bacterium]